MVNHYTTLGLRPYASYSEVKDAYRKLAFIFHPDRNQNNKLAEEWFKQINLAYEVLSNENNKKAYDLKLALSGTVSSTTCNKETKFKSNSTIKKTNVDFTKMRPEQILIYAVLKLLFK